MAAMITIANANALHIPLADRSVQCIVTSPPYFGLRDYGTAKWEGGSAECDHKQTVARHDGGRVNTNGFHGSATDDSDKGAMNYRDTCAKCGARRIDAQIGLESTPAAYVASIVAVMRECCRVLKDDGVACIVIGDSYAGGGGYYPDAPSNQSGSMQAKGNGKGKRNIKGQSRNVDGLKPKDLCGIPWRVAFALQDDGWYLRQDIIWSKPNPMPESVTDRCTKSHEYIFLLTKRARYYFDNEAIKEPYAESSVNRFEYDFNGYDTKGDPTGQILGRATDPHGGLKNSKGKDTSHGRNRRSVWTVATSPYSGAHFATFPPALIELMILAGTSARGECPHCGKAWVRVVERNASLESGRLSLGYGVSTDAGVNTTNGHNGSTLHHDIESITLGWRQQCACPPHEPIPQTVLDPFAGSGTTGAVAVKHGRRAVLLDLNTKYIDLQFDRTNGVQMAMPE